MLRATISIHTGEPNDRTLSQPSKVTIKARSSLCEHLELGGGHPQADLTLGPQVSPGVFRHGYAFCLGGRVWELGCVCPDTLSQ